jgi:hypothetical protein
MKKLSILMAAVLSGATAGSLLADALNPQPLPPGETQGSKTAVKVVKHKPSPGTNSGKTRRLLPKTHINPDGSKNLTTQDSKQIQGNITGSGGNNANTSFSKSKFLKSSPAQGMGKIETGGDGGHSAAQ